MELQTITPANKVYQDCSDDVLLRVETNDIEVEAAQVKEKSKQKKKAKKKKDANEKAIQSFFRVLAAKQVEQISQVDYKANILITLCSLLASVVGSLFLAHYEIYQAFAPSVLVLTFSSIISVFFSMLVVVSPSCNRCQAGQKRVNVMNFNQFSQLSLSDYKKEVMRTLRSEEEIYESISEDFYKTGKILKQKFIYLNWGYRIFLSGIFTAFVLGFGVKIW